MPVLETGFFCPHVRRNWRMHSAYMLFDFFGSGGIYRRLRPGHGSKTGRNVDILICDLAGVQPRTGNQTVGQNRVKN